LIDTPSWKLSGLTYCTAIAYNAPATPAHVDPTANAFVLVSARLMPIAAAASS